MELLFVLLQLFLRLLHLVHNTSWPRQCVPARNKEGRGERKGRRERGRRGTRKKRREEDEATRKRPGGKEKRRREGGKGVKGRRF